MPKKSRILVILQLCLVFVISGWYFSYPFMGQLFKVRSIQFLAANIEGNMESITWVTDLEKAKLKRQQERFYRLLPSDQTSVHTAFNWSEKELKHPFSEKILSALYHLFIDLSPYLQAWLFFSFLVSLLILFQIRGGEEATWLLALLALLLFLYNPPPSPQTTLYPTEEELYNDYLHESPATTFSEQWEQLNHGFSLYLASLTPEGSREAGEQIFHLMQLKYLETLPAYGTTPSSHISPFLLFLFLLWNVYFAYNIHKARTPHVKRSS